MSELAQLSLSEAAAQLQEGGLSSRALTEACLARSERWPELNALVTPMADAAFEQAEAADARIHRGARRGPLDGVPVGLKDIFCTAGVRTTAGSRILEQHVPVYDAAVVERLRAAGAVLPGKLNMDEFAMGSSNENSLFGPCRNPWDAQRVPGGSSGGSAAAVAAGLCPGSLGTDTGGSIRQPAAFCGLTGMRPTYGRISRYGMIAFASSLDQAGPLGHGARDVALLLQSLAGHDPRDSTSVDAPVPDYLAALDTGCQGLRIGLPREYLDGAGLDPQVAAAVQLALEQLAELGCEPVEVSLPHTEHAIACYYLIAAAEASSNLARYDGVRYGRRVDPGEGLAELYTRSRSEGFGAEAQRRILLGTYALSAGYYDAYYLRAQKVRSLIARDFDEVFARVDLLVTPTTPTPAFGLGEKIDDPLTMYLSDVFTVPVNLGGVCALSLPCGFSTDAAPLPLGLQLIGKPFDEATLLRVASAYQGASDWHRRRPEPQA